MNPPPRADGERGDAFEYAGAEPLDVALADRFAFVLEVPDLKALSRADQLAVLGGICRVLRRGAAWPGLAELLERIRGAASRRSRTRLRRSVASTSSSPRRSSPRPDTRFRPAAPSRLRGTSRPSRAVFRARGDDAAPEDAFYLALRHSMPDAAWGHPMDAADVLTVHRAAWADRAPRARRAEGDLPGARPDAPHRTRARGRHAVDRPNVARWSSDSYASLDRVARLATAAVLDAAARRSWTDLPAAAIETVAADYAAIASGGRRHRDGHARRRRLEARRS